MNYSPQKCLALHSILDISYSTDLQRSIAITWKILLSNHNIQLYSIFNYYRLKIGGENIIIDKFVTILFLILNILIKQ